MSDQPQIPLKFRLLQYYMTYLNSLQENPVLTKSATSGVLSFIEEFSAQSLTLENGYNYKWSKMFKMSAYGFFVGAPLGHFAYELMGRVVSGNGLGQQLLQLAISNGIILPIQTYVYIVAMGLIDDMSLQQAQVLVKKTFWPIMVTSWKYFPILQLLVFKYVPQILWVPFFNLVALLFGIWVNGTAKSKSNKK